MKKNESISWRLERAYLADGKSAIIGIDEAGRGPLAGPVVAAAVVLPLTGKLPRNCFGLDDSKKLSHSEREELFNFVCDHALGYGVGIIEASEIDEINILRATMKAMTFAVNDLLTKSPLIRPDMLLVDGNYFRTELPYPFRTVVHGDAHSPSIAAASIVAKVTRDRIMEKLHEEHPKYNFKQNKGYGTQAHRDAIAQHGRCPEHRKTFLLKEERAIQLELG
ncbi:MAG: ribonuclease HII [bacterium]